MSPRDRRQIRRHKLAMAKTFQEFDQRLVALENEHAERVASNCSVISTMKLLKAEGINVTD